MSYYNYDYSSDPLATSSDKSSELSAGMGMGLIAAYLALLVFVAVTMWKIFTKAGKPGWAAIVPIYNTIVMLQIVGRPVWWIFLMLIPFVNLVVAAIVVNDLARSFGKGIGWTCGLLFLGIIFYPILAFGKAKYNGPSVK